MAHETYPEIVKASPDAKTVRILEDLYSGQYGETNAILQYINQAWQISFFDPEIYETFLVIAEDEMTHQAELGKLIITFGGTPRYLNGNQSRNMFYYIAQSSSLNEMLQANIKAEQTAIFYYSKAIDAVTNTTLKEILTTIKGEEEEHLAKFTEIQKRINFYQA